ncbi:MAG: N-glycosylase/DNA lyase [Candidatus Woesearchaeota archaeon]
MKEVIKCVNAVQNGAVQKLVDKRLREFTALGKKSSEELFKELCFCILTANYSAAGGMRVQEAIGDGFLTLSEKKLAAALRKNKHRFPNMRAKYIVEARKHLPDLRDNVKNMEEHLLRDWLAVEVKGLGYKEASHFMRNIGFEDVAIIDFHIVDFLVRHKLIGKPKTLSKKNYLAVEEVLRKIAHKMNMGLGELDLYLWYCETGTVLK